jgi:hypothetical protein
MLHPNTRFLDQGPAFLKYELIMLWSSKLETGVQFIDRTATFFHSPLGRFRNFTSWQIILFNPEAS